MAILPSWYPRTVSGYVDVAAGHELLTASVIVTGQFTRVGMLLNPYVVALTCGYNNIEPNGLPSNINLYVELHVPLVDVFKVEGQRIHYIRL